MKIFKKAKRGFTLVELVVVIAVIAILAAVSVGAYFGITDSANKSKLESEARGILTNIQLIANGNDSNSYMDKESIHIKTDGLETFENKLNGMSGLNYEVTNQLVDENTEISKPTIYFIDSRETSGAATLNASGYNQYFRFAYYTPDVGGKCAIYTFATQECKVQDASFKIGESTEDEPDAPVANPASSIEVSSQEISIEEGTPGTQLVVQANGDIDYEITGNGHFTFEKSNGWITPLSFGEGTIRVYSTLTEVIVIVRITQAPIAVTGIQLTVVNNSDTAITNIDVDEVAKLQVGYIPTNTTEKGYNITQSGNGSVQFSSDFTTIKGVQPGNVTLTITSSVAGKESIYYIYDIVVNDVEITDYNLNIKKGENTSVYDNNDIELKVGEFIDVTPNYGETNPTSPSFTYNWEENTALSISEITGGYRITVNNTATIDQIHEIGFKAENGSNNKTITVSVKVVATPVTNIEIENTNITMIHHASLQLEATALPETATNKTLKYKLSEGAREDVVSVSDTGELQALNIGETSVTVFAVGGDVEREFNITVNPSYITSLTIETTLTNGRIIVGDSGYIVKVTKYEPSNASNPSYKFKSSNTSILEITSEGELIAKSAGQVEIFAYSTDRDAEITENTVKSQAISITVLETKDIYFVGFKDYYNDSATFKATFTNSSNETETKTLSLVNGSQYVYTTSYTSNFTKVKFTRHNSSGTTEWNNTSTMSIPNDKNMYKLPKDKWNNEGSGENNSNWSVYNSERNNIKDNYYIAGTFNNWFSDCTNSNQSTYCAVSHDSDEVKIVFNLKKDQEFKVIKFEALSIVMWIGGNHSGNGIGNSNISIGNDNNYKANNDCSVTLYITKDTGRTWVG